MTQPFRVHGRLWIEGPDGTFLGHGRVALLEQIDSKGSLSAAAAELGMSYRYAWKQVKAMNQHSDRPVIILSAGGRGGGSALLTAAGRRAISSFRQACHDFDQFLLQQSSKRSL